MTTEIHIWLPLCAQDFFFYSQVSIHNLTDWLQGVCEKSIQDVVERFWDIIEEININKVLRFMRDNIVSEYQEIWANVSNSGANENSSELSELSFL